MELNATSINLNDIVCQGSGRSHLFYRTGRDEEVDITLDKISLSRNMMNNELELTLANDESERVTVFPAETMVTILDRDGKQTQFTCMHN